MERESLLTRFHTFSNPEIDTSCVWLPEAHQHTQDSHMRSRLSLLGRGWRAPRFGMGVILTPCLSLYSTWKSLWDQQPRLLLQKQDRNHPITAQKSSVVKNSSTGTRISASLTNPVLAITMSKAPSESPQGTVDRHPQEDTENGTNSQNWNHKPKSAQFLAQNDLQVILWGAHPRSILMQSSWSKSQLPELGLPQHPRGERMLGIFKVGIPPHRKGNKT